MVWTITGTSNIIGAAEAMRPKETEQHLFSYGTLQTESVQRATFGRRLEGDADALLGYKLTMIETEDQEFAASNGAAQRNAQFTGVESDSIEGTVFRVTAKELEQSDRYEPADYRRVLVRLQSGLQAWVYVKAR